MNQTLLNLLVIVIGLAVPVLAGYAAKWLKAQADKATHYVQPDILSEIEYVAQQAVHAAEQCGLAGQITDKKKYAIEVAQNWLKLKGITIDLAALDAAIEAAVWNEINKDKVKLSTSPIGLISADLCQPK